MNGKTARLINKFAAINKRSVNDTKNYYLKLNSIDRASFRIAMNATVEADAFRETNEAQITA